MKYGESKRQLKTLRGRIAAIRDEIREVQKNLEPEDVEDHGFRTDDGGIAPPQSPCHPSSTPPTNMACAWRWTKR